MNSYKKNQKRKEQAIKFLSIPLLNYSKNYRSISDDIYVVLTLGARFFLTNPDLFWLMWMALARLKAAWK